MITLTTCTVLTLTLTLAETQTTDDSATQPTEEAPNQLEKPRLPEPHTTGTYTPWPWESDGVTGNWGGLRTDLESKGIIWSAEYTAPLDDAVVGYLMVNVQF